MTEMLANWYALWVSLPQDQWFFLGNGISADWTEPITSGEMMVALF